MKTERLRVAAGLVVISFVWGSTWLAIKVGLGSAPPFIGAGLRFAIASAVLFTIVKVRRVPVPRTHDAKVVYATLGLLSFGLSYALVYWAEQYISSGLASILFAAFPFFVAAFSHLLLPEGRMDPFTIGGICTGFAGLVLIFSRDIGWSGETGLMGMAAMLTGACISGLSLVIVSKHGRSISPFAINFVGMSIGTIVHFTGALLFEWGRPFAFDALAAGSILYLALIGSVTAFVIYYWLLKRVDPVFLSLTSLVNPVVAVILGAILLREELAATMVAGAFLVLAGLAVANWKNLASRLKEG